jgi:hypothetical protein
MAGTQSHWPRRSRAKTAIALFSTTAALLGGTAALGPASAGALVNEQHDCTSLPFMAWLSCLAENAVGGAGAGGGSIGGEPADGGVGSVTCLGGLDCDPAVQEPSYDAFDDLTGKSRTISAVYAILESRLQSSPDLLRVLVGSELEVRDDRCTAVVRRENNIRELIQGGGGYIGRSRRGQLRVLRAEWRFFECDDLWGGPGD